MKEKVSTDLLLVGCETTEQNWVPRKATPEETYDIENDPESIVFFDDVKNLAEVIVDIAKESTLVPIIQRLVDLLEQILGLQLPITVFITENLDDLMRNTTEMNFLRFNSLLNRTKSTDNSQL